MSILNHISITKKELHYTCFLLIGLCLSFSPLLFNFIWGNHDWIAMKYGNSLDAGLIEGRFSQYIFIHLFADGHILPIFNLILGFTVYSLGMVLLCTRFFAFSETPIKTILFLLTSATLPYLIEILYFQFIAFTQLCWVLTTVLALITADRATKKHAIIFTIISTLLLLFTIGGYPAAVNLFVTATALKTLQEFPQTPNFKTFLKNLIPYAISLTISLMAIAIFHHWLRSNGMMRDIYNAKTMSLIGLLLKTPSTLTNSLNSFIRPQPYFELTFKLLTTTVSIIFVGQYLIKYKNPLHFLFKLLLLLALLLCLKFSAWLTDETGNYFTAYDPAAYMVRTDFYAFPCFLMFCLFESNKHYTNIGKNLVFILAASLLWLNIKTDISYSKTNILGFYSENLLLERLTARVQDHPRYRSTKNYTVVQTGEIGMRPRFYYPPTIHKYGYYTLHIPHTRHWMPYEHFNFFSLQEFALEGNNIDISTMDDDLINFLSSDLSYWPNKHAVYLDNSYAVIVLTPEGRNMLSEQFKATPRWRK